MIPASGAAMAFSPGTNFDMSRTFAPFFPKLTCVRRTHESGSSEMRHRTCRTRTPFLRPNSYHMASLDNAPPDGGNRHHHGQIHLTSSRKRPGGEKQWRRRNWQARLLDEYSKRIRA